MNLKNFCARKRWKIKMQTNYSLHEAYISDTQLTDNVERALENLSNALEDLISVVDEYQANIKEIKRLKD